MHQIDHYELIITRDPENSDAEVLLLTLEAADLPEGVQGGAATGDTGVARWKAVESGRGIELVFQSQDGEQRVQLAPVSMSLAEKLETFKRVLVVVLEDGQIASEHEFSLGE